jgi:hypothetical protein
MCHIFRNSCNYVPIRSMCKLIQHKQNSKFLIRKLRNIWLFWLGLSLDKIHVLWQTNKTNVKEEQTAFRTWGFHVKSDITIVERWFRFWNNITTEWSLSALMWLAGRHVQVLILSVQWRGETATAMRIMYADISILVSTYQMKQCSFVCARSRYRL